MKHNTITIIFLINVNVHGMCFMSLNNKKFKLESLITYMIWNELYLLWIRTYGPLLGQKSIFMFSKNKNVCIQ